MTEEPTQDTPSTFCGPVNYETLLKAERIKNMEANLEINRLKGELQSATDMLYVMNDVMRDHPTPELAANDVTELQAKLAETHRELEQQKKIRVPTDELVDLRNFVKVLQVEGQKIWGLTIANAHLQQRIKWYAGLEPSSDDPKITEQLLKRLDNLMAENEYLRRQLCASKREDVIPSPTKGPDA